MEQVALSLNISRKFKSIFQPDMGKLLYHMETYFEKIAATLKQGCSKR